MADPSNLPEHIDVDMFWAALHNVKQIGSTVPLLLKLVRALLALPASNADSERSFSMVRKIDSEDRSHLHWAKSMNFHYFWKDLEIWAGML